MKPYPQTNDRTERRFNAKLSGLRTICTENVIGLWKQRFTCLRKGLGTKLNLTVDIIVACAVLHNLAIFWQEPEPEEEADEGGEDENYDQNDDGRAEMNRLEVRAAGQAHRDWLCQNYCWNLASAVEYKWLICDYLSWLISCLNCLKIKESILPFVSLNWRGDNNNCDWLFKTWWVRLDWPITIKCLNLLECVTALNNSGRD